ncbi:MAG: hypothetical protein LC721_11080, partial [Actinobacteria bacterium]|nr:hypothetical protein [Actinomycetota bacterium]
SAPNAAAAELAESVILAGRPGRRLPPVDDSPPLDSTTTAFLTQTRTNLLIVVSKSWWGVSLPATNPRRQSGHRMTTARPAG